MASRKNKWRRRGRLEFRRETRRYSDGTPWGGDVLWIRTVTRRSDTNGRGVAYVTMDHGEPAQAGLGIYLPVNSKRDAVAIAKASRLAALQYLEDNDQVPVD